MAVARRRGDPWTVETFFAEAATRSADDAAGLRLLFDAALSFEDRLSLVWGAGPVDPRFFVRRVGAKSGELLSGWASGGVGVQAEALRELLPDSTPLLANLSTALGIPDWADGTEPGFDAALLQKEEVSSAVRRLLAAIANLGTETDQDTPGASRSQDRDPVAWLLLTYGDERGYAGNRGYDDDPQHVYRYDSFVQNHRNVRAGDAVILKASDRTLGCARIERIEELDGFKDRQRCPECKTAKLKPRKAARPQYRCDSGHEFDEPLVEQVSCRKFAAHFGDSFVPLKADVDATSLRDVCPNYNRQLAMQRIDPALIAESIALRSLHEALKQLVATSVAYLLPDEAEADADVSTAPYVPSGTDTREAVMRNLRARRGQGAFRQALRAAHGDTCMVTGCTLIDLLEAAHISPYRGAEDHHVENGLLLRADIHTLFDLELLGIEPESLVIRVSADAAAAGYGHLDGQPLRCPNHRPSRAALESRWTAFTRRCGSRRASDP